ncbi:hypothetical protein [Jeongeupia sp. USM3]|nr:hypothetical protein [Jeongeupia sp. USM3]
MAAGLNKEHSPTQGNAGQSPAESALKQKPRTLTRNFHNTKFAPKTGD